MNWRRALAAVGLGAFLLGEALPARPNLRALSTKLSASARLASEERRLSGTSFFFDPDYGPFLLAVRRATPPDATIALRAPRTHELYTYQASYILAPRRLVGADRAGQAQYEAIYGVAPAPGALVVLSLPKGSLVRLR
jgi:hypothetical protein